MPAPSTFGSVLSRVVKALEKAGLPYMLVGGLVAIIHGSTRATRDVVITVGIGPDRLDLLLGAVREAALEPAPGAEELARRSYVLPCVDPRSGLAIDLILAVSAYEEQALKRTRPVRIGRARVRCASVEDLLIHKVVAGRARDMEDATQILRRNLDVDRDYILRWLREFEATTGDPLSERFLQLLQS